MAVTPRTPLTEPVFRGSARFRIVPHRCARDVAVYALKCFSRQALLSASLAALALGLSPRPGSAQVVRGTVIDEASSRGLPGVVVVLLDSAGKRVAGVLADDEGRYAIRITA